MTRLFLRLFLGVQVAVLLSVSLTALLLIRDVGMRRRELMRDVLAGNVSLVERTLAGMDRAEHAARLEALARTMHMGAELVQGAPPRLAAQLARDGDAVREARKGPVYYRRLSTGEILALGPVPRIVRFEPGLFVMLVLGVLAIVNVVALVLGVPLVRDLRRVHAAVDRFGQGDFSRRAALEGEGAVADLSRGFDRMADRVARMVSGQRHLFQAVSHELRTPHARMRFALELLETASTPAERARHLRSIEDDLAEVDELVEELLTYMRFDTDAPPLPREALDAFTWVTELAGRMQQTGFAGALDVEGTRADVQVNPKYFRRAIENLLTNATRHARSRVQVRVEQAEAWVSVTIEDDGPGVPAHERERVFEPFATLEPARTPGHGNTGLGLAIVQRIVRMHGGEVTLGESALGGARFTTRWPAA